MASVLSNKPHVLAVPLPFQGHVKPLMKLSRQIAKHGIKVTFVNVESVHTKAVVAAKISGEEEEEEEDNVVLVSIPEGQSPEDDTLMPLETRSLIDLIKSINSSNPDEKVTCVIVDVTIIGSILETVQNMGAELIAFAPFSAACLATMLHIPDLLERGIIDSNGSVKKSETISLPDDIPWPRKDEFVWNSSDPKTQEMFFRKAKTAEKIVDQVSFVLINTCYELESSACNLSPKLLPIAPLMQKTTTATSSSNSRNLYLEDASCLSWLDNKPDGSVIYVSFGSSAVLSQQQLDELALGLDLSGRPFLWVVRSDLAGGAPPPVYPNGFPVSKLGKIVGWAPQEKVLSHPSIACFFSHCGWNSTLEGLSMGVPFLCWPYFADQFQNQSYICDKWKIGLKIDQDENGIRSRHEIKQKIDMLFSTNNLKENALAFKEVYAKSIISEGGSSYKNLRTFIEHASKK